jgi:fluoride exporter
LALMMSDQEVILLSIMLVMLGGALGTGARYGLNGLVSGSYFRGGGMAAVFPLGTLIVNVSGCFLVGLIYAFSGPALGRVWIRPEWRDFLIIGFCGGYTTFSSYGIQTLALARDGEWLLVGVNIIASNFLGLLAVFAGRATGLYLQGGSL